MGGASVLAEVLGRDDRPASLRGPLLRTGRSTWVQHAEAGCRAAGGVAEALPEQAVVAGCPLCANTADVARAVQLLTNLEWNRDSILDEVQEALQDEGEYGGPEHTLARVRLNADPAWRKPKRRAAWEEERPEGPVPAWVEQVADEVLGEVFEQECFGRSTKGEVTLLAPLEVLANLAPRSVSRRVPHLVLAREWSAYALVSLDEDEVAALDEPSRTRRTRARAVRTTLPVEVLLSEAYEEVWPLALEVLEGRDGEGLDLDEILQVVEKVLQRPDRAATPVP